MADLLQRGFAKYGDKTGEIVYYKWFNIILDILNS